MYIKAYPAIETQVIGSLTQFTVDIHPILRYTVVYCALVFVMKYTYKSSTFTVGKQRRKAKNKNHTYQNYNKKRKKMGTILSDRRSEWSRGLRRRSSAARLLRLRVRIPPGAWMFVCCECCVLSGRGLCDGLIIRSEESYRLWRVVVCDQETS